MEEELETRRVVEPVEPVDERRVVEPVEPVAARRVVEPVESVEERRVRRVVEPVAAPEEQEVMTTAGSGVVRRERAVRTLQGEDRDVVYEDVAARQYLWASKLSQVVWLFIGIIEALIVLRLLLRALGASPDAGFANFIYGSAGVFLAPFFGLVGSPTAGGAVLEVPDLVAIIFYALLGWLFVKIIWLVLDRPPTGGASHYRRFRA